MNIYIIYFISLLNKLIKYLKMKSLHMLILVAFSDLIMLSAGSILSSYKTGYESLYFPMYDFNHELSDCRTDQDCETRYVDYKDIPNKVIVSNHIWDEFYNGLYS